MKVLKVRKGARAKVGKVALKKPRAAAGKGAGSVGDDGDWLHNPLTDWSYNWKNNPLNLGKAASKQANPLKNLNRKLNK